MTTEKSITRIKIIVSIIVAVALILVARLYLVQVVHGDVYSKKADHQYVRPQSSIFDRGTIYLTDKNGGRFSAATLKSGYTLAINPKVINDPKPIYDQLAPIVDIDRETFFLRAGKKNDPYEEIAHKISEEKQQEIEAMNIEGVRTYEEKWRFYPGNDLAAQTLGFVAFKGDDRVGRYGVEREYQEVLDREGESLYVNFFAQVFSGIQETVVNNDGKRAGDVVLSLDPTAQTFLEETLEKTRTEWSSEKTMGIIMDPETGAIKAMATTPSFNLNEFSQVNDASLYANPLVENVYEMGSIIKPITMAAGLDAGVVTAKTTYNDKGSITLNGSTISNYDGEARGVVDMQTVLNESLNTGASFVAGKLGNERFRNYLYDFGIDEKTGIDLPNEARSLTSNLESPRDLEYATASFGQGIALSPIQTVRALAVLANGGTLVTPHVGEEIRYELGFAKDLHEEEESRQVIDATTSEEITRMLVRVVDEALKNGEVKLDRYSVAAKTGTAQVAKPNEPGYYDNVFNHSFFGYFPAYDPEYLVFLMNIRPQGAKYASQTLTEPFMDLVRFLINYYEIPPDRTQPTTAEVSP